MELNKERVALFLIAKNADVNARDNHEQTPLHHAAAKGLTDMCRFLLDFNVNMRLKDVHCWTSLHHAVNGNHMDTATLLIKRGVDMHAEDHKHGRTALHLAAEKGFAEMAEMLIIRGADLTATGDAFFSKTPLHLSCLHGHTDVTEVLVRKGADVNAMSGLIDQTPLHMAVTEGHLDCVKILLMQGKADVNLLGQHTNGYSALHLAALKDHWHIMEFLVAEEKRIHLQLNLAGKYSINGHTALHIACQMGHAHIVHFLIDTPGVDREALDPNKHTPLHIACKYGHYDIVEVMIEIARCNYRAKSLNGKTPIDYVADSVVKDRLKLLCYKMELVEQHEADMAQRKKAQEAQVALEMRLAAEAKAKAEADERDYQERRRHEFRRRLSEVCDVSGEIVIFQQIAEEFYDQDINDLLLILSPNSGALGSSDQPSVAQATALTRAAYRGFYEIVAALLHWRGIHIDYQESDTGNSALHYAAMHNYRDIVELLLLHGAQNHLVNRAGKVAANLVQHSSLREIIRNVRLIATRHVFQNAVLQEIYNHQRKVFGASTSGDGPLGEEKSGIFVDESADVNVAQVVFERNLLQPETIKQVITFTTPQKTLPMHAQPLPQPQLSSFSSAKKDTPAGAAATTLKLPPLNLPSQQFAGGTPNKGSNHHQQRSPQKVSHTKFIAPSMGGQHGALFTPHFATELMSGSAAATHHHYQTPHGTYPAGGSSVSPSIASGSVGGRFYGKDALQHAQQREHWPYKQRLYKDRYGGIEGIASHMEHDLHSLDNSSLMSQNSHLSGYHTLPPLAGPQAMFSQDPSRPHFSASKKPLSSQMHRVHHANNLEDDENQSLGTLESRFEQDLSAAPVVPPAMERAVELLHETQLDFFLQVSQGTAGSQQLRKRLQTKYGDIPASFGGCRADVFYTTLRQQQYHLSRWHRQPMTSVYHMQYSYLPQAFDNTDELLEVKDFLWMLGQPYYAALVDELRKQEDGAHAKDSAEADAEEKFKVGVDMELSEADALQMPSPHQHSVDNLDGAPFQPSQQPQHAHSSLPRMLSSLSLCSADSYHNLPHLRLSPRLHNGGGSAMSLDAQRQNSMFSASAGVGVGVGAELSATADDLSRRDKRTYLFELAEVLNQVQRAFTTPTDLHTDDTETVDAHVASQHESVAQMLLQHVRSHRLKAKSSGGHTYSASGDDHRSVDSSRRSNQRSDDDDIFVLPRNLHTGDLPHLQQFARHCRSFLVVFLTVYDPFFPTYLANVLATASASEVPSQHHQQNRHPPSTSASVLNTVHMNTKGGHDAKSSSYEEDEQVMTSVAEERLILQALHDQVLYLAEHGYLDVALVQLLRDQLLPLCSLYALELLLTPSYSSDSQSQSHSSFWQAQPMRTNIPFQEHTEKPKKAKGGGGKSAAEENDQEDAFHQRDPLRELWSPLLLNPPRSRRVAIDVIYELALFLMRQAETSYPTDAIRAHLWATQARQLLQEYREERHRALAEEKEQAMLAHEHHLQEQQQRELRTQSNLLDGDHVGAPGGEGDVIGRGNGGVKLRSAFQLWLEDLALSEYEKYFASIGFRLLEDFQELSEEDCYRYFPFVQLGDMRRLARHCAQLQDGVVTQYEKRARKLAKQQRQLQKEMQHHQQVQSVAEEVGIAAVDVGNVSVEETVHKNEEAAGEKRISTDRVVEELD